jgi:hypothetical protein
MGNSGANQKGPDQTRASCHRCRGVRSNRSRHAASAASSMDWQARWASPELLAPRHSPSHAFTSGVVVGSQHVSIPSAGTSARLVFAVWRGAPIDKEDNMPAPPGLAHLAQEHLVGGRCPVVRDQELHPATRDVERAMDDPIRSAYLAKYVTKIMTRVVARTMCSTFCLRHA